MKLGFKNYCGAQTFFFLLLQKWKRLEQWDMRWDKGRSWAHSCVKPRQWERQTPYSERQVTEISSLQPGKVAITNSLVEEQLLGALWSSNRRLSWGALPRRMSHSLLMVVMRKEGIWMQCTALRRRSESRLLWEQQQRDIRSHVRQWSNDQASFAFLEVTVKLFCLCGWRSAHILAQKAGLLRCACTNELVKLLHSQLGNRGYV